MLLLRSCRRFTEPILRWNFLQAHTVSVCFLGNKVHLSLPILTIFAFVSCWAFPVAFSAFSDSTQKDLLKLIGNVPVKYEGKTDLWRFGKKSGDKQNMWTVWAYYALMLTFLSRLKAAPITSPLSCGWWTHSPSHLLYVSWGLLLTWSSERGSMLMPKDASICQGCTTGIM